MVKNERDVQVQKLFDVVQERKEEIKKAERPNWLTNCTFGYDSSSKRTNIQVVGDVVVLADVLAFLYGKAGNHEKACTTLGIEGTFKWMGYTLEEWSDDLKTRVNKIQIIKKKKELEAMEKSLNKLLSPELKEQMELDAISKSLGL